jgi:phospholipid methyltransferase
MRDARTTDRLGPTLVASLTYVSLVVAGGFLAGDATLAVYTLSFWHYYLYWLAYRFGAVPPPVFRRDAIVMKTVALGALGFAYLAGVPDPLSLAVVGAGFALNAAAARALGMDRTYYGCEVAGLPKHRVTAFPYSIIAHPMLTGNVLAFGATLLDAGFRQRWWPLAAVHVAMNLGLLIMEVAVTPLRRGTSAEATDRTRSAGWVILAGAAAAAGLLGSWLAAGAAVCVVAYAWVLFEAYSRPARSRPESGRAREGRRRWTLHERT